jgi:hypothetical protein
MNQLNTYSANPADTRAEKKEKNCGIAAMKVGLMIQMSLFFAINKRASHASQSNLKDSSSTSRWKSNSGSSDKHALLQYSLPRKRKT